MRCCRASFERQFNGARFENLAGIEPNQLIASVDMAGRSSLALRRRRRYAVRKQENRCPREQEATGACWIAVRCCAPGPQRRLPRRSACSARRPFRSARRRRRSISRNFRSARPLPTRRALTGAPRKLKLSWNAGAVCLAPLPVAIDHGFFQKHNLDVELVNYSGSTDQLLEAIATGKTDAGLGMALRWLKPLEQGFDVKIAAGTHGGCMRVLSRTNSGVDKLADLKGKIVARRRSRRSRQELLLDPARQAGHRSQQGRRLARLSRQSAAARRREGRSPGVPGLRSDRLSLAEGQRRTRKSPPISTANTRTRPAASSACAAAWCARSRRSRARITQALLDAAMFTVAESGQGRGIVPALRAQDRQPRRICRRWSATTPIITIPSATC